MTADIFRNRFVQLLAASLVLTGVLALVWRYTPLADVVTPRKAIQWMAGLSGHWWAPVMVALLHTPASIVMFPRPLLTFAAVIVFGPWIGFAVTMSGVMIATAATYWAGMLLDERTVKRWAGPRMARITKMLQKKGLSTFIAIRLLPVAPFAVESAVAGALRMPFWSVMLGTFIGMLPGVLATTVLGDQIAAMFREGEEMNRWIAAGAVAVIVAMFWGTRVWWKRMQAQAG